MYGVVRKKILEFRRELRSKCFIMRNNQCRFLYVLDDIRHGKGLSRTGRSEECDFLFAALEGFLDLFDSLRLVSSWFIVWLELKHIN